LIDGNGAADFEAAGARRPARTGVLVVIGELEWHVVRIGSQWVGIALLRAWIVIRLVFYRNGTPYKANPSLAFGPSNYERYRGLYRKAGLGYRRAS
jgi:hypothetical protein